MRHYLAEDIRQVLVDHAVDLTVNQGLHSWRCQYPDTYGMGPCDCVDELVQDLVDAVNRRRPAGITFAWFLAGLGCFVLALVWP